MYHFKRYVEIKSPESQNVTLFGNKVFADEIKMRSYCIKNVLKSNMISVPIKGDTRRGCHVTIRAGNELMRI